MTHTARYHAHYRTAGEGHIYQGRFKSFPVQDDGHFHVVCRYVERNALAAGLVERAEDWPWGDRTKRRTTETMTGEGNERRTFPATCRFCKGYMTPVAKIEGERNSASRRSCATISNTTRPVASAIPLMNLALSS